MASSEQNGDLSSVEFTGGGASDSLVARRRRDEIITAAMNIIASEGLHRLSLARIEQRAGMTRGQLTYYFPTKEAILLAVFDRMLERMIADAMAEAAAQGAPMPGTGESWQCLQHGLKRIMDPDKSGRHDQLRALIHTFMAQIPHRDDFCQKLAVAHADWRDHLTQDIAASNPNSTIAPPVLASIVMALFQGLSSQLAVDPQAFDREEMVDACLKLLSPFFKNSSAPAAGDGHE